MKKFVPINYIILMVLSFFIIPVSVILFIVFATELNKLTFSIAAFCVALIIAGPYSLYTNDKNASIVITNDYIFNCVYDGTPNIWWKENISKVQSIKVADNAAAREIQPGCVAKKVLLIDFGSGNVKYIPLTLFTEKQIKQIIEYIEKRRDELLCSSNSE
jgi:hypothetical protein